MDVAICTVNHVRPSSLTHRPKPLKLSFKDQLTPPFYSPLILFYPMNDPNLRRTTPISNQLKWSLSKTLEEFYPFSGRIVDNHVVHDYLEGAPYTEARVEGRMSEFLAKPRLQGLNQLLPCQSFCLQEDPNVPQVAVQLNIFDCGGLALGICLLHKLIDGGSGRCFASTWAAISRGSSNGIMLPNFHEASSLFPPQHPFSPLGTQLVNSLWFGSSGQRYSRRRFVFGGNAVKELRTKARSEQVEYPSRTEAVQAFLLKSAMEASRSISNHPKPTAIVQKVNIRTRTRPRLQINSIGNLFDSAMSYYSPTKGSDEIKQALKSLISYHGNPNDIEENIGLDWLVALERDGVAKINDKSVKSTMGGKGLAKTMENLSLVADLLEATNPDVYRFTSWLKFGFDLLDYGWGTPVWSALNGEASGDNPCNGPMSITVLKDYKPDQNNRAVEAWVEFEEEVMDMVEQDQEFLEFASPNPSVMP